MPRWGEAVRDWQARFDAQEREKVRAHYESFADPMKPCQRSALPVGYCGGCYRGEHPRADRRSA